MTGRPPFPAEPRVSDQELLGFGSAGKVFKAKQKQDNKEVALKVMQCLDEAGVLKSRPQGRPGEARRGKRRQEMLRIRCGEFNVLRTLRHPHIVNVLNFWTHDNEAVLAMELHSQSNLQQVVRKASSVDEMTSKHLFKMLDLNLGSLRGSLLFFFGFRR